MGNALDDETLQRVSKLHTVLRPYLLRRLKRDVEKELPSKYEHLVLCALSKRQRFLYDEFMSRAITRDALQSGVYQKIANILMQLRKVCNHPDLFEVRPVVTSFAMEKSAISDYEIKELLVRRQLLKDDEEHLNLNLLGFQFIDRQQTSLISATESRRLDATELLPFIYEIPGEAPPRDTRTIKGFREYTAWQRRAEAIAHWTHMGYLNRLRLDSFPIYSQETIAVARRLYTPLLPLGEVDLRTGYLDTVQLVHASIKSYSDRAEQMAGFIDRFAFVTPTVVALDMPRIAFVEEEAVIKDQPLHFDAVLHRASVKLQIAFPDPSLLQYDCGKLQELTRLLREKKAGGHRVLIFTQMTKILDVLEIFLNFHGYLYLRLDGATKIEDRQYITERFNSDPRIFCFIASSRSGGVGIKYALAFLSTIITANMIPVLPVPILSYSTTATSTLKWTDNARTGNKLLVTASSVLLITVLPELTELVKSVTCTSTASSLSTPSRRPYCARPTKSDLWMISLYRRESLTGGRCLKTKTR